MRDRNQQYEVVVRPKGRTAADEYNHKGETWIEGRSNSWYEIELVNHTNNRVLAVLSVDGVGVIDGESASYDSKGFVIEPWQRTLVPGWLMNSEQAAKFVFSSVGKSYASQTGKGGNPGVIGVAWFPAQQQRLYDQLRRIAASPSQMYTKGTATSILNTPIGATYNASNCVGAASTGSMQADLQQANYASVGTGWGESVDFNTQQTHFVKASNTPSSVLVLRYDSADNLQAMGIRLRDRYTASSSQAFPGNSAGYCKPPPVWVRSK